MLPVVAIIGRPNVGKSTLFNSLTHSQAALVADRPGVTRDRHYGFASRDGKRFIVIDTGGLGGAEEEIELLAEQQTRQAILEADCLLFLVDGKEGLSNSDHVLAKQLRTLDKPILFVINKVDSQLTETNRPEFYRLGLKEPLLISASHSRGLSELVEAVFKALPEKPVEATSFIGEKGIQVAILGRPNVGKSTLTNQILGQDRVIVSDQPGTTRDSIFIPLEYSGQKFTLIDTAGIRRKSQVADAVEKFSVIKTLQALEVAHVAVVLIDAESGLGDQDLKIMGYVLEAGKGLVIAINKWDAIREEQQEWLKKELNRRLQFASFAKFHFISALKGFGTKRLFISVERAYESAGQKWGTPLLSKLLTKLVTKHPPPLIKGRRIKLLYAHMGGHYPPVIVIHGRQTEDTPGSYKGYLENAFRKTLKLEGTPVRIELRSGSNPYTK